MPVRKHCPSNQNLAVRYGVFAFLVKLVWSGMMLTCCVVSLHACTSTLLLLFLMLLLLTLVELSLDWNDWDILSISKCILSSSSLSDEAMELLDESLAEL